MFRIGDFSKLAKTTVKTLRFYEEAGLLCPAETDKWTGYRYYSTEQLYSLQKIMAMRQSGLTIEEIRLCLDGGNISNILETRKQGLLSQLSETEAQIKSLDNLIKSVRENKTMNYQAVVKEISEYTVYYKSGRVKDFSEITPFILKSGEECIAANPSIKCLEPDYCFVSYLDGEYRPSDMTIMYAQAVTKAGKETDTIKFKKLDAVTAVCVYHKGAYNNLNEAYAYTVNWIKDNGYSISELPRERYIDGIWNKENENDWLTEIQIPVVKDKKEVKDNWGDTKEYAESESKSQKRNAGEELRGIAEGEKILAEFGEIRAMNPDSDEAKNLVIKWQNHITKYYYECTNEILLSLADMYVADERFTENLDKYGKGTAEFMCRAIKEYCK